MVMENKRMVNIANVVKESTVDGPGIRLVIFTQGCIHQCLGCHNQHTWNPLGGTWVRTDDLIEQIKSSPLIDGVTISGGEPFLQTTELIELVKGIKALGLHVIVYTGFTWEKLITISPEVRKLLSLIDVLIDGPFIQELKDLDLPFRGSTNQRIINTQLSLKSGTVVMEGDYETY